MGYEKVDLQLLDGVNRLRAWATGGPAGSRYSKVTIGTLADGRWFASQIGVDAARRPASRTLVAVTERAACELAQRWIGDGRVWGEVPAQWDGRGMPADGRPWHRVGNRWLPGDLPPAVDPGE